jgi:hypothetical protein
MMNYPEKIELVLTYKYDPEDTEIFTERVAAEKIGEYYKLIQVPTFAPNIAYGDIVKVEYEDGKFHFEELIEESGYSVVHIVFFKLQIKPALMQFLDQHGCGVNSNVADNYLVVSIPPTSDCNPITPHLKNEEDVENISFRATYSKIHAKQIGI